MLELCSAILGDIHLGTYQYTQNSPAAIFPFRFEEERHRKTRPPPSFHLNSFRRRRSLGSECVARTRLGGPGHFERKAQVGFRARIMFSEIRVLVCLHRQIQSLDTMHFFEPLNSDSSSKETFGGNTNPGGVYKWNVLGVLGEPFPDDFVDFPTIYGQKRGDSAPSNGGQ